MTEEPALSLLLAAKIDARSVATAAAKRMQFTAQCLNMLAKIAEAPNASCELLPGMAERLRRLSGDLTKWTTEATDAAAIIEADAEAVETLLLEVRGKQ